MRGLSALDSPPSAKQIAVELVFSIIGALVSRKTVGSRFITFTQLSLTVVSFIFADDSAPVESKLVAQKLGATPASLQPFVATVVCHTAPIGRILGGSFATVATVATVEAITRCGFFSCNLKDHFREIRQIPLGLQQTKGHEHG